ncbi:phage terminase small subunit [Muricomes intestini]|uniref:Phage terminase small subunit n=1 Tax=Muricomes intestini TaxID=1796634 RepID=A0A4V2URW4_9FIRM|nr:P27 family phage terminase small subunit [Muricomes intestini]TCS79192.1 phage terminase small subunit [Muricomes intestini]
MSKNIPTRETIRRRTIAYMKELGTYKLQYNQLIEIYTDMIYQYNVLSRKFEEGEYSVIIATEKSEGKKNPVYTSLEGLRKDIGVYSDKLRLNPKAYNTEVEQPEQEKSPFAQLMEKYKGVGN